MRFQTVLQTWLGNFVSQFQSLPFKFKRKKGQQRDNPENVIISIRKRNSYHMLNLTQINVNWKSNEANTLGAGLIQDSSGSVVLSLFSNNNYLITFILFELPIDN